jgi:hypothetical protein
MRIDKGAVAAAQGVHRWIQVKVHAQSDPLIAEKN